MPVYKTDNSEKLGGGSKFADMTIAQAKAYMGLDEDANDFAIDEKFYQLSKVIRASKAEDSEAKLDDLSEVYDIATGRRDARLKAAQIREKKKKFLGKTSDEWLNFFSYNWFKIIIIAVIIAVCGDLVYNIFIKPRPDCTIISVGHFEYEGDLLDIILPEAGYENPYLNCVDVVVPNDEGDSGTAYSEQTASTLFVSEPNVIISDTHTVKYYFSEFCDISGIYSDLRTLLPEEQFNKLRPVFCSELEYMSLIYGYELDENMYEYTNDGFNPSEYNPDPIMIGITVEDDTFLNRLGYISGWDDGDYLVFGVYGSNKEPTKAEKILLSIFKTI